MSTDPPTIYLSNWSSYRTPGRHGPGRKLSIMAAPRPWEHGDGHVHVLTPRVEDVLSVKAGTLSIEHYRLRYDTPLALRNLGPGILRARVSTRKGHSEIDTVEDGDTLCCACSAKAARAGQCHRAWAAEALARAGWRVVLDGEVLGGERGST